MKKRRHYRIKPRFFMILALFILLLGIIGLWVHHPSRSVTGSPIEVLKPSIATYYTLPAVSLPTPLAGAAIFQQNGVLTLAGGSTPHGPSDWIDTLTDHGIVQWRPLPHAARGGALISTGSQLAYIGGILSGQTHPTAQTQLIGASGHLPILPQPLAHFATAYTSQAAWIIGGGSGHKPSSTIWKISVSSLTPTIWGHLPHGVYDAAAAISAKDLWVIGGRSALGPSKAVWEISRRTHHLIATYLLPTPIYNAAAVLWHHQLWIIGGQTGPHHPVAAIDVLTHHHLTTVTQPLPTALAQAAVSVQGNAVWIIGGQTSHGPSATIYAVHARPKMPISPAHSHRHSS
ncbi:MAG: hypothetical protein OWS74_09400 [Firmicutes bacterium]|nr:hypothetical protein [Bacillota bacterium]